MKTSGLLIIYISENEDFDLWKVLCQIPPEERDAYVKNALRNALNKNSKYPNPSAQVKAAREQAIYGEPFSPKAFSEAYSDQVVAGQEKIIEKETGSQITDMLTPNLPPLSFEDISLNDLYFNRQDQTGSEISFELDHSLPQREPTASNNMNFSMPAGLNNLLNNIGEESDENLIEYIKSKKNSDEDDTTIEKNAGTEENQSDPDEN